MSPKSSFQGSSLPASSLPPSSRGGENEKAGTTIRHYRVDTTTMEQATPALLGSMSTTVRHHLVASFAEFVGTFFFLLMALGATQSVNSAPSLSAAGASGDVGDDPARLVFISLAFGTSLTVHAWVFFRVSGGQFNPAVSLALALRGAISWVRAAVLIPAQVLGGIAASGAVKGLLQGVADTNTTLGANTSVVQGLFLEMFLTTLLILTILMLAVEKHRATFVAPLGIGLSLFMAEMVGVRYTGGSLNPARSFGPAVVTAQFKSYHWIYWIGPILGALLASGLHAVIKAVRYETVNEGQDHDGLTHTYEFFRHDSASQTATESSSKRTVEVTTTTYGEGPSMESGEMQGVPL